MSRSRLILRGLILLAFAIPLALYLTRSDDSLNVVLISIDTLRADHLGTYGYSGNTTPHIDRFAEKSVVFERASSQSNQTLRSHASMFTGLLSTTLRVNDAGIDQMSYIPRNVLTLGELFKERGYRTAAFTDGGLVSGDLGFNRGFDVYRDVTVSGMRQNVGEAIEYLRSRQSRKPFFLFLHTYDVHSPYRPKNTQGEYNYRFPEPDYQGALKDSVEEGKVQEFLHQVIWGTRSLTDADSEYLVAHYDRSLKYVDLQLARLFAFLDEEGYMRDTIVIITSDHGERFRPLKADGFEIWHANFFSHSGCTHEMLQVPYLIYAPGLAPERIARPVSASISIMPTLMDLLGWKNKGRYELEGRSVFLREQASSPLAFCFPYGWSMLTGDFQYLIPWNLDYRERHSSFMEADYTRIDEEKVVYRLDLDRPVERLVALETPDENVRAMKRAVRDQAAFAKAFEKEPVRFYFVEQEGIYTIHYRGFRHIWQVPGEGTVLESLSVTPGDWLLSAEAGVWSTFQLDAEQRVQLEITVENQTGGRRKVEVSRSAMEMDASRDFGGYKYLTEVRVPLERDFVTAAPLRISLRGRQLDAGDGEAYYIWKKLMIGSGRPTAGELPSTELQKLKELGYIH